MADEYLTLNQAREYLKCGRPKLKRLLDTDIIPLFENPLDRREKLIRKEDIDKLKQPVPRAKD